MDWLDIKGHDDNIHMLKTMLATGRMPHALLFAGPKSIGKTTLARVTAKAILCLQDGEKPCGKCESCKLMEREAHPDLIVINPEGGSIKIDQIRMLQQEAGKTPHLHENRVCIIKEAGRMTVQAQNSLLKLLEEPPQGFVFILTTMMARSLLTTILSRCRVFRFNPLHYELLADLLTARGISPDTAKVAARLSGGRTGDALSIAVENGLVLRDKALAIMCALQKNHANFLWETADLFDKMGGSEIKSLLTQFLYLFRDLYLLVIGQRQLVANIDISGELISQAQDWDENGILGAMGDIREAENALSANANVRLTSEALLIHLIDRAQRRNNFADSSRGAL